ncbi:MAG: AAA-like domain-containing protein [Planctomycetaceae bacterium]|nr:AAA-like domain-containing protein [Planctomycetaceae bacterium]
MKYFNVAGPCSEQKHYMINASTRLDGVEELIDNEQYFVIHAARQSGKTTYLQDLSKRLNNEGKYYALYCSLEKAQNVVQPERGIPTILDCIVLSLQKSSSIPFVYDEQYEQEKKNRPLVLLTLFLMNFVKTLDKPLVILFDEADCLSEGTLISFLRQLRDGYNDRSIASFVHSVALVGMRNIRDYKAQIRLNSQSLGSASPFNIATESLTLNNFTKEEIIQLYQQHTTETGQIFANNAIELVHKQTQGQPWLVNAIAREVIVKILQSDYKKPVTAKLVNEAIQNIILRRPTHIDSLLERLKEEQVRKIIEPMILGDDSIDEESDDFLYTKDLGLIRIDNDQITPANPIYSEVIVRKLSSATQSELQHSQYPYEIPRYLTKNKSIDMVFLMRDFQQFWRENSRACIKNYKQYKEAAPHLVLMAFLQRVVNGGGQIIREMAVGSGRLDLCLVYNGQKYPIELKIRYGKKYLEKGLEQTANYIDICGCKEGWLVIFDRRVRVKWDDKIFMKKKTINGKKITIVGL